MAKTDRTDGTFDNLASPLAVPKAPEDPQADLDNKMIPGSTGLGPSDPMDFLEGLESRKK